MLFIIYTLYTIPLAAATQLVSPESLENIFPGWNQKFGGLGLTLESLSGILSAAIYSLFFSMCPLMFKAISNFGSGAVSASQGKDTTKTAFSCHVMNIILSNTLSL